LAVIEEMAGQGDPEGSPQAETGHVAGIPAAGLDREEMMAL